MRTSLISFITNMDNNWHIRVKDLQTNEYVDLSSDCACTFEQDKEYKFEVQYENYETIDNEIQIGIGQGIEKKIENRILYVKACDLCESLISFFIPHTEDERKIDTIELMTYKII